MVLDPKVFVDMTIVVPETSENFRSLCAGAPKSGKPLYFEGSAFHCAILDFACQGGHHSSTPALACSLWPMRGLRIRSLRGPAFCLGLAAS